MNFDTKATIGQVVFQVEVGVYSFLNRKLSSSISQVVVNNRDITCKDEFRFHKNVDSGCQGNIVSVLIACDWGFRKVCYVDIAQARGENSYGQRHNL